MQRITRRNKLSGADGYSSPVGTIPAFSTISMIVRCGARVRCSTPLGTTKPWPAKAQRRALQDRSRARLQLRKRIRHPDRACASDTRLQSRQDVPLSHSPHTKFGCTTCAAHLQRRGLRRLLPVLDEEHLAESRTDTALRYS